MCPVCDQPMVSFELDGVEIDRCLECGGTWLDAGELEMIAEAAGVAPGKLTEALDDRAGARHGKRPCVRCGARLRIVTVSGVELDHCPRGHGLWLDRDEEKQVIASFADGEEGAVARFFGEFDRGDAPAEESKGG